MIFRSKTSAFALLLGSLLSLRGLAATPQVQYTAEELQKSWERVYGPAGHAPLFQDLLDEMTSQGMLVFGAQDLGPESASRDGSQPRSVAAVAAGDPAQVVSHFPVKSLSAEHGRLLYGSLHKVEGLAQKFQFHLGAVEDRTAPADFSRTLQKRRNALDMERFTANVSLFLLAERMTQKCMYYSRALAFATTIRELSSDQFPDGWASYAGNVQAFIRDSSRGFARIPAHLCQFQTKLSRSEDEAIVRKRIDTTLVDAMNRAIEKHEQVIRKRKDELQEVVNSSHVTIPIDKVSALQRGFRDTNSLLTMIKSDLLLLYKDDGTTEHLLKKIDRKIKNIGKGSDQITVAHQTLDQFEAALKPFLMELEAVARLPMLNDEQKKKVSVCQDLSKILSTDLNAANAAAHQERFNSCLLATAGLYREARETLTEDPAQVEFASKIAMLLSYFQALKSGK